MAQHYSEIIGIIFLLVFAATMFYQGTMIVKGHRGYRHSAREEYDSINMRRRVEKLLRDKIHDDME